MSTTETGLDLDAIRERDGMIFNSIPDRTALLAEIERLRGQVARALANHDHADTCALVLGINHSDPCTCWRAALAEPVEQEAGR